MCGRRQDLHCRTKSRFLRLGSVQPRLKLFKRHLSYHAIITLVFSCGAPSIESTRADFSSLDPVETLLVFSAVLIENHVRVFLICQAFHCADFFANVHILAYHQVTELRCVAPKNRKMLSTVGADTHTLFMLHALSDGKPYEIIDASWLKDFGKVFLASSLRRKRSWFPLMRII